MSSWSFASSDIFKDAVSKMDTATICLNPSHWEILTRYLQQLHLDLAWARSWKCKYFLVILLLRSRPVKKTWLLRSQSSLGFIYCKLSLPWMHSPCENYSLALCNLSGAWFKISDEQLVHFVTSQWLAKRSALDSVLHSREHFHIEESS